MGTEIEDRLVNDHEFGNGTAIFTARGPSGR